MMLLVLVTLLLSGTALITATISDDDRRRHEQAIRNAIRLAGMTMLQAAQEAGIDQAQFTKQIQLIEGSLKRLAMQPKAFWRWYAIELSAAFGMPTEAKRSMRLALATMGTKRTVRMQLPLGRQEERVG